MKNFNYESESVTLNLGKGGLYPAKASEFVQEASNSIEPVIVSSGGKTVDGKSILGLMSLALTEDSEVTIATNDEKLLDVLISILLG